MAGLRSPEGARYATRLNPSNCRSHPSSRFQLAKMRPSIVPVLWIALLASAMLLPFLPGRHDPLATSLSAAATGVAFGWLFK